MSTTGTPIQSIKDRRIFSLLHFVFFFLFSPFALMGQQGSLTCNTRTPWVDGTFAVTQTNFHSAQSFWENPQNVEDSDTSNFAVGHILVNGSLRLRVSDNNAANEYSAGNFAGFRVSSGVFNGGLFTAITIKTFLNNGARETKTLPNLVGFSSGFLSGQVDLGFITTLSYNQIEINITTLLGIANYNVYYAVMEPYCAGPDLACNEQTRMNRPTYPVTIDYPNTGSGGVSVGVVDNPEGAVSASTTDYASLINVASVLGSTFLTVEEHVTDYPAGTYVGFDIENLTLLGAGIFNYITLTSYVGGVQQEQKSGSSLLAGAPILTSSGRNTVGFVTTTNVDKVKISVNQPTGVTLGTTRVYSAIFQEMCAGPDLDCNTMTTISTPAYPVFIEIGNTGLTGAACGGCNVIQSGNVIDDDTSSYAQIIITAGALTTGSLAVKDQLTNYPANTFAGYRIENPNLVDANALSGITISTYLDGVFKESETNLGALITVGSGLLLNDDQQIVGFVTSQPFDEVKISLTNAGTFNIGTTRIHELVLSTFCPAVIECDTNYFMNHPVFPVYIDAFRTGVDGVACVVCAVEDEENVITEDTSDYATITVAANIAASASIAVADALYTYPQGTRAGFVIEDLGFLIQADLFETLTISTYNDGVFQESATGVDLIDVALLILFISDDAGRYNVGFETTLPFDEIRITVGSLAAAINQVRVYSAFTDTRASNGGELFCLNEPIAVDDEAETDEDTPVTIDVLANDNEGDHALETPTEADPPNHGSTMVNPDSTITYIPDSNFVGVDTFTYSVCDNGMTSLCDTARVIVTVHPVRDTMQVMISGDSSFTIHAYELTTFSETAISITLCNTPLHGTITIAGDSVKYEPDQGFNGEDTMCVYVCHPSDPTLCDTTLIIFDIVCPSLEVKVFLEGPYDDGTGLMTTTLNEFHVLPGQDPDMSSNPGAQLLGIAAPAGQPYNTPPWNWPGTEGDDYGDEPGDRAYDEEVTDWILISVRENDSLPTSEIWKCAGLLYHDGSVVFPPECPCVNGVNTTSGYYIVVEHRNHLPIMSRKIHLTNNGLSYDFTQNQSWLYFLGNVQIGEGQKDVGSNFAMYAGNSEQVNSRVDINASDDGRWLNENGTLFQYKAADHNMDGDVNATDEFVWLLNNGTFTLLPF